MTPIEIAQQEIENYLLTSDILSMDIENISLELSDIAARHNLVLSTSQVVGASLGVFGSGLGFAYDSIEGGEVRLDFRVPKP